MWRSAWGWQHGPTGREQTFRGRFADARSRPYRTGDGDGALILFDAGRTTQLFHLAVAADAQGRGLGRRMLELARGVVAAGADSQMPAPVYRYGAAPTGPAGRDADG